MDTDLTPRLIHDVRVMGGEDGLIILHCPCTWSMEMGYNPSVTDLINEQTAHRVPRETV